MNVQAAKPLIGILTTMGLLAGICLLGSCASEPIELAPGTHWRDAAKVAGLPTVSFSYQINGRKYDRVTFRKVGNPVVLENGRIFSVTAFESNQEWYRRLNECVEAGELPFENGLGPLHSLVMEQGKLFQREGWPRKLEQDSKLTGSQIAVVTLLAPTIPIGATAIAGGYLALLPVYAMTGGSRRKAQAVTDTLLDSDSSYAAFLAALGEPDRQISKGTYSINQYPATVRISEGLSCYHLGLKNGRVVWAADVRYVDLTKIDEYRKAHGLP